MPLNKRTSSITFNKLTNLAKDTVGDQKDFDVVLEEDFDELEDFDSSKKWKNSIDLNPLETPFIEEQKHELETLYGWLVSRDSKYVHYFDIDFMIEIGWSCGDFKWFKELMKEVKILKEKEG